MTRAGRAPAGIAARAALLGIAVALLGAVVAGTLAVGLIRRESDANAERTLAGLADAAQRTADDPASPVTGQDRALAALSALDVSSASLERSGRVRGGATLARDAVRPTDVADLRAGRPVSDRREVDGAAVLVEGRPTLDGAIVLVQARADALRPAESAIRRLLLAIGVALVLAVSLALLFARRLARPLERTSRAALLLAEGRRDVDVPPEGPREVADVAAAINALAASLAVSESRAREFLLSVSHDLRTPLTAITAYAESLADGVVEGAEVPAVGHVLLDESRRLARLVSDLLDLARLDAATFRIDLTGVDLVDLVRRAAVVWGRRCAAVGVVLTTEFGPDPAAPLWVRTDPGRVRQVIDGLCENALRVTPTGRPMVLAVRADGAGAQVEVRDGGPGLAEADLAVAFDRGVLYERYRGVRPVGTGLGLAIVHGLVTRLGGQVRAGHSSEGGARFTVHLPRGGPGPLPLDPAGPPAPGDGRPGAPPGGAGPRGAGPGGPSGVPTPVGPGVARRG